MIIKIMPENEFEKQRVQEVEHTGVKEFFMFGNKKEEDGTVEFHDWNGNFRFLEGGLYHYLTTVTNEKNLKSQQNNEISLKPQGQIKSPMIKKGTVENANVKIIDVEELSNQIQTELPKQPSVMPFPPPTDEFVETPAIDENLEAEDKDQK